MRIIIILLMITIIFGYVELINGQRRNRGAIKYTPSPLYETVTDELTAKQFDESDPEQRNIRIRAAKFKPSGTYRRSKKLNEIINKNNASTENSVELTSEISDESTTLSSTSLTTHKDQVKRNFTRIYTKKPTKRTNYTRGARLFTRQTQPTTTTVEPAKVNEERRIPIRKYGEKRRRLFQKTTTLPPEQTESSETTMSTTRRTDRPPITRIAYTIRESHELDSRPIDDDTFQLPKLSILNLSDDEPVVHVDPGEQNNDVDSLSQPVLEIENVANEQLTDEALAAYNEILPKQSYLLRSPIAVETSHNSPSSVTVSIFGAFANVLSHSTESLAFLTSTTIKPTAFENPYAHTAPNPYRQSVTPNPISHTTKSSTTLNLTADNIKTTTISSIEHDQSIIPFNNPTTTEQPQKSLYEILQTYNKTAPSSKTDNVFTLAMTKMHPKMRQDGIDVIKKLLLNGTKSMTSEDRSVIQNLTKMMMDSPIYVQDPQRQIQTTLSIPEPTKYEDNHPVFQLPSTPSFDDGDDDLLKSSLEETSSIEVHPSISPPSINQNRNRQGINSAEDDKKLRAKELNISITKSPKIDHNQNKNKQGLNVEDDEKQLLRQLLISLQGPFPTTAPKTTTISTTVETSPPTSIAPENTSFETELNLLQTLNTKKYESSTTLPPRKEQEIVINQNIKLEPIFVPIPAAPNSSVEKELQRLQQLISASASARPSSKESWELDMSLPVNQENVSIKTNIQSVNPIPTTTVKKNITNDNADEFSSSEEFKSFSSLEDTSVPNSQATKQPNIETTTPSIEEDLEFLQKFIAASNKLQTATPTIVKPTVSTSIDTSTTTSEKPAIVIKQLPLEKVITPNVPKIVNLNDENIESENDKTVTYEIDPTTKTTKAKSEISKISTTTKSTTLISQQELKLLESLLKQTDSGKLAGSTTPKVSDKEKPMVISLTGNSDQDFGVLRLLLDEANIRAATIKTTTEAVATTKRPQSALETELQLLQTLLGRRPNTKTTTREPETTTKSTTTITTTTASSNQYESELKLLQSLLTVQNQQRKPTTVPSTIKTVSTETTTEAEMKLKQNNIVSRFNNLNGENEVLDENRTGKNIVESNLNTVPSNGENPRIRIMEISTMHSPIRTSINPTIAPYKSSSPKINSLEDSSTKKLADHKTTKRPNADLDDIAFLNQLQQFLNPRQTTRKPDIIITPPTTTRSPPPLEKSTKTYVITPITVPTVSPTPMKTTITTVSSTVYQETSSATPPAISLSPITKTDDEDLLFLNSLRLIPKFVPSPSTQAPVFTNPIIKYFLQRQALRTTTHKPLTIVTTPKTTSTTTLKTIPLNGQPLTKDEIKQHEQDLASINNDLGLLSTLLGRPISQGEVLRLARQNRTIATKSTSSQNSLNALPSKSVKATPSTASFTLLPTTPASLNMQAENIKHLQGLLSGDAMPTKAVEAEFYGKTNDALLAALLKQQGIGPIYNNLPVDNAFLSTTTTTTTRVPRTRRPSRPILDGLSWLWQTWQQTAPVRYSGSGPVASSSAVRSTPTRRPASSSFEETESAPTFEESPGGSLLQAAVGVTRAVTQFLGAAFQGVSRSFQSAFTTVRSDDATIF